MARKVVDKDEAILSEDDLAGSEGQAVEKKVVKPRSIMKTGTKRKAPIKQQRQALSDRTNVQDVAAGKDDAQEDDGEADIAKAKRAKTTVVKKMPTLEQRAIATIPETQEHSFADREQAVDRIEETTLAAWPVSSVRQTSLRPASRAQSAQPSYTAMRERSTSIERERRGGDVETRRQLATITRECETLTLKNQALEDMVRDKAESNFDKLKREADQKTRQADELIAALRSEISLLRSTNNSTTSETTSLQKKVDTMSQAYEATKQENSKLEKELISAKDGLQAAENERKSLEAKLVAVRQQMSSDVSDTKSGSSRMVSKPTEAQREAKMKLDLYADLTGLIICGVKRKDGEDEFDCLQTGRNGALHFRLSVVNESGTSNPKTPGMSYEEAEFSYEPMLELPRDENLVNILPDYLSEDICFPRNHAVKFYAKVVESMTKRVVIEEEQAD